MNGIEQRDFLCRVELMGPLRVTSADQTQTHFVTQKAGALLAYLALRPGPHPRERVIDLLWPDMELSAGRNNLSTTLVTLRRQLEPPDARRGSVLVTSLAEVGLNSDTVTTDTAVFADLLKRAARTEDMSARAALLQRAIGLYRGDILPGHYQDWAVRESERLRARLQEALQQLARDLEMLGDLMGALQAVQHSMELDPYSEERHCHLLDLYVQNGQMTLAKEAQARFERLFVDEFGATLSAATCQKVAQIFRRPAVLSRPQRDLISSTDPARTDNTGYQTMANETGSIESNRARSVLPVTLGKYFGREAEVVRLARLLLPHKEPLLDSEGTETPCRLVTLTGLGGMGKTRLALEFARQAGTRYGFWCGFVSLADLTRAGQITAQIAASLKVALDANDPLQPICAFLNAQDNPNSSPMLILDNLEHLLVGEETSNQEAKGQEADAQEASNQEAAEETASGNPVISCIQALLERVPGLMLLCTSRQRLAIRGEHLLTLAPLPVPNAQSIETIEMQADSLAAMLSVPSVRLYVDRARAVRPDFGLTPTNAPAVAALCRQLEGCPLALELAAAWVRALPPRKMWERLTQGLDIPPGSYADLPARHRTLSTALEWSLRLLTPAQQRFFAYLSIFRGGWTLEAAEAVCEEPDALLLLSTLQEASLVTVTSEGEAELDRYAFLETVRTFGLRQLELRGEKETTANRHTTFFLKLAEQADAQLRGADQAQWLSRLEADHDNIRAALDRCLAEQSTGPEKELGTRMACALFRFWNIHGHWSEAHRYLEAAHLHTEDTLPLALRAELYNVRAGYARLVGELAQAQTLYEHSLQLWRQLKDPKGMSRQLHNLGFMALLQGDYARAQPLYEESLTLAHSQGDTTGIADALHHLGWLAHEQGDYVQARTLYMESLALRRPLNDLRGNAFTLQNLANLLLTEGDYAQAKALQEENLAIRQALGDRIGTADALSNLGSIAQEQRDLSRALILYREALEIRHELGDKLAVADSVRRLAGVAILNQQWTRAARLHAAIRALRAQAGFPRSPAEEENLAAIRLLQEQMPVEAFAAAWNAGSLLTWEQAAVEALAEP